MILQIKQERTNFGMSWVLSQNGERKGYAQAPFEKNKFQVFFDDNCDKRLYYNPRDLTWGKKLTDRLSFKYFESSMLVGTIVGCTKKLGFLKSYAFYEFKCKDKIYYGYEVGFGKGGLYFCIYQNEILIAIVEKELKVINYRDSYIVYTMNSDLINVIFPFVIYYDATAYGDVLEVAVRSVKVKRVNTIQPELKNKFDASFIEAAKQEDNHLKRQTNRNDFSNL